jgi:hypothetical protein
VACRLGCDATYELTITDRCARNTLLSLDDFTRLTWGRVLDDVSRATVTLPADCCGKLADVRSWHNELHIFRNGAEVWSGPVVTQPNCRSGITLVAYDFLAWLGVRVIRQARCYDPDCGGAAEDPVQIAHRLVADALSPLDGVPTDPCLMKNLLVIPGGQPQEREYKLRSAYVLAALKDLARGGLDFTAVGRSIILMPEGHSLGTTALLTCDAFADDVCVTEDGLAAATRAIVTGKANDGTTVVSGAAGGVDPFFGLIEVLHNDDSIRTAMGASRQAAGLVAGANPPPLLVQPPQGSSLTPEAPVCLEELVPGVEVPVVLDCTCRDAMQTMRLAKLDVTVDAAGEKVSPLLVPTRPGVTTGL